MLRTHNPQLSLKFYALLNLVPIFVFNTGSFTIYYLGPPSTTLSNLSTTPGLLELYHIPSDADKPYKSGNEDGGSGFGHLGFVVPDVGEVVERLKEEGFEVIKPLGEAGVKGMGVNDDIGEDGVVEGYRFVFGQLAFVRDPDGYWVELVPEVVEVMPTTTTTV